MEVESILVPVVHASGTSCKCIHVIPVANQAVFKKMILKLATSNPLGWFSVGYLPTHHTLFTFMDTPSKLYMLATAPTMKMGHLTNQQQNWLATIHAQIRSGQMIRCLKPLRIGPSVDAWVMHPCRYPERHSGCPSWWVRAGHLQSQQPWLLVPSLSHRGPHSGRHDCGRAAPGQQWFPPPNINDPGRGLQMECGRIQGTHNGWCNVWRRYHVCSSARYCFSWQNYYIESRIWHYIGHSDPAGHCVCHLLFTADHCLHQSKEKKTKKVLMKCSLFFLILKA